MKKTAWVSNVHKIFWKETFEAQLFYDTYVKLFGNYVEVVGMGLHDERDEPCEFIKVIPLLPLRHQPFNAIAMFWDEKIFCHCFFKTKVIMME